jgi:hypothetical protein
MLFRQGQVPYREEKMEKTRAMFESSAKSEPLCEACEMDMPSKEVNNLEERLQFIYPQEAAKRAS